ncbi:hypothetical protein ABW636_18975 [Aquimarina sp. 2201CG1-2-11]|uniref:hypothetical protein n=1 Tax=Aquimarina discodermiae TaxID=3231043 RepID=UPI003461E42F
MYKTINLRLGLFIIMSFLWYGTYAQTTKSENDLISDKEKFMTLSQSTSLFESAQLINQQTTSSIGNMVYIQQIGTGNLVTSNSTSEFSNINIVQNGDYNKVEIDEHAKEVEKTILQTGTNNSVTDFSFNADISTKLELTQEGNNLIFEKFGSNELSKNLKFKMSGESRTIIIRSF